MGARKWGGGGGGGRWGVVMGLKDKFVWHFRVPLCRVLYFEYHWKIEDYKEIEIKSAKRGASS